jgi:hypothetical protein
MKLRLCHSLVLHRFVAAFSTGFNFVIDLNFFKLVFGFKPFTAKSFSFKLFGLSRRQCVRTGQLHNDEAMKGNSWYHKRIVGNRIINDVQNEAG